MGPRCPWQWRYYTTAVRNTSQVREAYGKLVELVPNSPKVIEILITWYRDGTGITLYSNFPYFSKTTMKPLTHPPPLCPEPLKTSHSPWGNISTVEVKFVEHAFGRGLRWNPQNTPLHLVGKVRSASMDDLKHESLDIAPYIQTRNVVSFLTNILNTSKSSK